MSLFKDIADRIFGGAAEEELMVVFAGEEENSAGDDYEFGIFQESNNTFIWLPASATDEKVIGQLRQMKAGQTFRITKEDGVGGMGTLVKALEVDETMPVIEIPKGTPLSFSPG